jgi:hypothetical protein
MRRGVFTLYNEVGGLVAQLATEKIPLSFSEMSSGVMTRQKGI